MGRNPKLQSPYSRTPRGPGKEYGGPIEQMDWDYPHSNQVSSTILAGIAKMLKECDLPHHAFALAIWDGHGNLSSTYTSPALDGYGEVITANLPKTVPQILHHQPPTSKRAAFRFENGEAHAFAAPLADDFGDLAPFEDYDAKDARVLESQTTSRISGPRRLESLQYEQSRPSKRYKPNAKAYSAAVHSQSSHNDSCSESEIEYQEQLMIGDRSRLDEFYMARFTELQQTVCKTVCKTWIKVIEPRKQSNYPYSKGKEPQTHKPPWWPEDVTHREPDHIKKPERMKLLLAILRVVENKDPKGEITYFSVAQLRKSIETDTKIPHDKRVILGEVLKAREYEERYERNECDPNMTITVRKSTAMKGYPRRSRHSSNSVKDEAQNNLASEQQRRSSSTDDSSIRSSSTQPRQLQPSKGLPSPSTVHTPGSLVDINNDVLQRHMIPPRSPEPIGVCNTSFHSSQDQPSSSLPDEMYLEYTRHPPVDESHPAGQDDLTASLHSMHTDNPFALTHHGSNVRNLYQPVPARVPSSYASGFSPTMISHYANQMQMNYAESVTPLSANQQAIAAQQRFQPPLARNGCDTLSQPLSNQSFNSEALCSMPRLKSERQLFQDPFHTESADQPHGLPQHAYM